MSLQGKTIVVAGAGGPAGTAAVRRLAAEGAHVVAADVVPQEWPGLDVEPVVVDLLDEAATREWAGRHRRVDGLLHLVGGWRGGKTFEDTDLADWTFLEGLLVRTLQHTTLAFHPALLASGDARVAIVSQPSAHAPAAGAAPYATAKAAAETWTLALADSFSGTGSAAAVVVVRALLTDAMRDRAPDRPWKGFTHVDDLARHLAGLWERSADDLNGRRLELPDPA